MTRVILLNRPKVESALRAGAFLAGFLGCLQLAVSHSAAADPANNPGSAATADTAIASARRIAAGDVLQIEVVTNSQELSAENSQLLLLRPSMLVAVGKDGLVSLGENYGSVPLIGKTISEAETAVGAALRAGWNRTAAGAEQAGAAAKAFDPLRINTRVVYLGNDVGEDLQLYRKLAQVHPSAPRIVKPGDILQIESLADGLNTRRSVVEPDGSLALGARWGRVNVAGRSLLESESVVRAHLETHLKDPEVQVTYAGHSADGSNPGQLAGGGPMEIIAQFQRDVSDLKLMLREFRSRLPR